MNHIDFWYISDSFYGHQTPPLKIYWMGAILDFSIRLTTPTLNIAQ